MTGSNDLKEAVTNAEKRDIRTYVSLISH